MVVYASETRIPVNRTREEIIATLERYGADALGYGSEDGFEMVYFRMTGRRV